MYSYDILLRYSKMEGYLQNTKFLFNLGTNGLNVPVD